MDDVDIERYVRKVIPQMRRKFAHAHYNVDIEEIAWYSAYVLSLKYEWEQSYDIYWLITYREILRELNKVRNVYVTDPESIETTQPDDDYSFSKLTFDSLTPDEKCFIDWMINDGLSKTQIAELTHVSIQTVQNRWKRIIEKLKKENNYYE